MDRADGVLADDHGRRCRRPRPRRGRAGAARVGQLSRERCDDDGVAPPRTVRRPRRRAPRGDEWDPVQPDAAGGGVEGRARDRGRVLPRSRRVRPRPRLGRGHQCGGTRPGRGIGSARPRVRRQRAGLPRGARAGTARRELARRDRWRGLGGSRRRDRVGAARRTRAPGRLRRCRRARNGGPAVGRRRRDAKRRPGSRHCDSSSRSVRSCR